MEKKIEHCVFVVPQTPATAPAPKTPLSSSENIKFSFGNAEKSQPQTQKQLSKEDKTSAESSSPAPPNPASQSDAKPSIFGNFNGTPSSSIFGGATPVGSSAGAIFGANPLIKPTNNSGSGFTFPGFGGSPAPAGSTSGFQFSTPSTSTATSTTNTTSTFSFGTPGNQPLFGNAPKFSFADVGKQAANNDKSLSNGNEQRGMNVHRMSSSSSFYFIF